jgi:hypothetical protein
MRILNLVLFSPDMYYQEMYKITSSYYKRFGFVDTVYYYYDDIDEPNKRDGDFLIIRGKECRDSSITTKTILAFEYFQSSLCNYDYVIRTNISSIVQFDLILSLPNISYGGYLMNLKWLDPPSGIHDDTHFGTIFASGTCIIFSSQLIQQILENRHDINETIMDDVAFGIFAKKHFVETTDLTSCTLFMKKCEDENDLYSYLKEYKKMICYRNRVDVHSKNRLVDVEQMKCIVKFLALK